MRRRAAEVAARADRFDRPPRTRARPEPGATRTCRRLRPSCSSPSRSPPGSLLLGGRRADARARGRCSCSRSVATLAVNRSVFFPSEQAATAEVAFGARGGDRLRGRRRPGWDRSWSRCSWAPSTSPTGTAGRSSGWATTPGNRALAGLAATGAFAAIGAHAGVRRGGRGRSRGLRRRRPRGLDDVARSSRAPRRAWHWPGLRRSTGSRLPLAVWARRPGSSSTGSAGGWRRSRSSRWRSCPSSSSSARARATGSGRAWRVGGILGAGAIASGALWLLLPSSTLRLVGRAAHHRRVAGRRARRRSRRTAVAVGRRRGRGGGRRGPADGAYLLAPLAAMAACDRHLVVRHAPPPSPTRVRHGCGRDRRIAGNRGRRVRRRQSAGIRLRCVGRRGRRHLRAGGARASRRVGGGVRLEPSLRRCGRGDRGRLAGHRAVGGGGVRGLDGRDGRRRPIVRCDALARPTVGTRDSPRAAALVATSVTALVTVSVWSWRPVPRGCSRWSRSSPRHAAFGPPQDGCRSR